MPWLGYACGTCQFCLTVGSIDFYTETFPEYDDLLTSGLVWQERHGHRASRQATGQHTMVIEQTVTLAYTARHRFD